MSRQSDFGRLFRKRPWGSQEPIENYTSEALAIAIEHDDGPMRRALGSIRWNTSAPFDASQVIRIRPRTQAHLPACEGVRCGYLDLVLELTFQTQHTATAWVEVKVDTGEHGEQLDVYAEHAGRETQRPHIFTIGRSELRSVDRLPRGVDVGWLSWKDLAAVIEQPPGSDARWDDLLSFLSEEGIAWRSLPSMGIDVEAHLKVLIEVNSQIRNRWPNVGMAFFGNAPQALRSAAVNSLIASGRLIAAGGPVTYGIVASEGEWVWCVWVGIDNYQRVRLDADDIVRRANSVGLSSRWQRSSRKDAALALEAPQTDYTSFEDVTKWFSDALGELDAKGILQDFLDGVTAKTKSAGAISSPVDLRGAGEL